MKIRIVCYEDPDAWILGKFAVKLHEQLIALGADSSLVRAPDDSADVNHHIAYVDYEGGDSGLNSLMVTHVDSVGKVRMLRRQLETADLAVCMSAETVADLRGAGLPREKICYVNPGHDGVIAPRRLRVGITTRLYEDGRKKESAFENVLAKIPSDDFHFIIMGAGWGGVVEEMRRHGFSVDLYPAFDLKTYREQIPTLDFYVYFGRDEGSMGFVDAVTAGVATIVTPQGFHLDVEDGITHPIDNVDDLATVLSKIAEHRRQRASRVADWSWRRYAEKHLELWRYLAGTGPNPTTPAVSRGAQDGLASLVQTPRGQTLGRRLRFLQRLVLTSIQRRLMNSPESNGQ